MPDTESTQTRRTLLRTTALALAGGIAGCTSLSGGGQGPSQSTQTSPPSSATPTETTTPPPTQTETQSQESTPTQTQTEASTSTPARTTQEDTKLSFPYLHPATGTTGYGIDLQGSPVQGMNDAPVDMYYWSDYTCPYCQVFSLQIHPKIAKNAVANGSLRIVFLELPYKTKNSWPAAILAKSVWKLVSDTDPNLYWKWHHAIYEHQKDPHSGWADLEKLFEITRNVGIDTEAIARIMETKQKQIKQDISAEIEAANKANLKGTPAFILYNRETGQSKKILGAQPYPVFKTRIQSLQ